MTPRRRVPPPEPFRLQPVSQPRCTARPRRGSPARRASKLLLASRQPLPTKLRGDNIVGNEPAGIGIGQPGLDLLDHIQVIDDIFKATVIGQPIEKIFDCLLRRLHVRRIPHSTRRRAESPDSSGMRRGSPSPASLRSATSPRCAGRGGFRSEGSTRSGFLDTNGAYLCARNEPATPRRTRPAPARVGPTMRSPRTSQPRNAAMTGFT